MLPVSKYWTKDHFSLVEYVSGFNKAIFEMGLKGPSAFVNQYSKIALAHPSK